MKSVAGAVVGLLATAPLWAGLYASASTSNGGTRADIGVAVSGQQQAPANPHGPMDNACSDCHTTASWQTLRDPLLFDHDDVGYEMIGAHSALSCLQCHTSLNFAFVPVSCADCHTDPHQGELGFLCEACHTPRGWSSNVRDFEAHFLTLFPLSGAHANIDCEACHTAPPPFEFQGAPTDCYSCHAEDFAQTTQPNHAAQGFTLECQNCHSTEDWDIDDFHATVGIPAQACNTCHASDYLQTSDPSHVELGFSMSCEQCHTVSDWTVSDFHSLPVAPDTNCYACHAVDYQQASNPNHLAGGFPTDCAICHTTRSWDAGEFTAHDSLYFPIYSGEHREEWNACADCHTNPGNFAAFECINCHEHRRSEMDDEHDDVSGYVWASAACLACHPRGER